MFNLGLPEILVISVAALLVFGPKRLPELAKGLGKGIRDFKKALEGNNDDEKRLDKDDGTIDVTQNSGAKGGHDSKTTKPGSEG